MTKIGILGGIGPEATSAFYQRLITGLQNHGLIASNKDYPQLFINSIPAVELTGQEENEEDLKDYINGLQELDQHQPDFIVMICNTIHLYLDRLQTFVQAPILDIRKQIKKNLDGKAQKTYAVLGSPLTIKKGLYDFDGYQRIEVEKSDIEKMTTIINSINSGFNVGDASFCLESMIEKYADDGENTVILGCTELALYPEKNKSYTINSINVLVEMVIERLCLHPSPTKSESPISH